MRLQHLVGSGLRLAQRVVNARALIFGTYEPDITEIVDKVRPYTMTSVARVAALCDAMSHIVRHRIAGAFVECGVWKGGSSMAAALRLIQLNQPDRAFYLFDTFEGMTPPSEIIVMWRDLRDFWSSGALSSAMWGGVPATGRAQAAS